MKLVVVAALLSGCALDADLGATEQASGATQYMDLFDFPSTDQGQWYDLVNKLDGQFTGAGITPLTFGCSVTGKLGTVHDCVWTFAAARAAVDPTTAAITVDAPTFQCHVKPNTTSAKLIAWLANTTDLLHTALPGTSTTIEASLDDCFAHPAGGMVLGSSEGTTYVEAGDYYTTAANRAKWATAQTAMASAFDFICGDTFCGSDYTDLRALDLACAITKSTGNVKSCTWTFGGSYQVVDAKSGAVGDVSKTFSCSFTMHATLPQLIAAIVAAGPGDAAIQAPLPGETTSAYDALGGCLP